MKTTTKNENETIVYKNDRFYKKVRFLKTVVFQKGRFYKARRFINDL